ncbi:MAG TPA: hypothetical protein PLV70_10220 [Flavobacteriales bacterium]|nr:hypothetical protein [Flavobacteriales bacterium]HRO38701.1 hypothetical protein [Flavobacteriales bacterium]HRQ85476.1 hypothetical protein [Flavobacteriales bacterium]
MAKAYTIHIHSPIAFIAAWVAIVISGTTGMRYLSTAGDPALAYTAIVLLLGLGLFIASRLSTAKIRIQLDEHGFQHEWIKRFILSKEADIHLSWDQVIDYVFEEDRTFYKFELTLQGKLRYRFYRQTIWPTRDDFHKFKRDFPHLIHDIQSVAANDIIRGKTVFEKKWFKWVLAAMTIVILLLLVAAISNDNGSNSVWALGALACGALFYWTKIRANGANK